MTKEQIIKLVKESNVTKELKEMVIDYINLTYDEGFTEGMKKGVKIALDIQSSLMNNYFKVKP